MTSYTIGIFDSKPSNDNPHYVVHDVDFKMVNNVLGWLSKNEYYFETYMTTSKDGSKVCYIYTDASDLQLKPLFRSIESSIRAKYINP